MQYIYLIVFLFVFSSITHAQSPLVVSDSTPVQQRGLINTDSVNMILLSAEDTGLASVPVLNQKTCVIAFIGCDESHIIVADFTNYFYAEYVKTSNKEAAFLKAKNYLFLKYPDSLVTPVLN